MKILYNKKYCCCDIDQLESEKESHIVNYALKAVDKQEKESVRHSFQSYEQQS